MTSSPSIQEIVLSTNGIVEDNLARLNERIDMLRNDMLTNEEDEYDTFYCKINIYINTIINKFILKYVKSIENYERQKKQNEKDILNLIMENMLLKIEAQSYTNIKQPFSFDTILDNNEKIINKKNKFVKNTTKKNNIQSIRKRIYFSQDNITNNTRHDSDKKHNKDKKKQNKENTSSSTHIRKINLSVPKLKFTNSTNNNSYSTKKHFNFNNEINNNKINSKVFAHKNRIFNQNNKIPNVVNNTSINIINNNNGVCEVSYNNNNNNYSKIQNNLVDYYQTDVSVNNIYNSNLHLKKPLNENKKIKNNNKITNNIFFTKSFNKNINLKTNSNIKIIPPGKMINNNYNISVVKKVSKISLIKSRSKDRKISNIKLRNSNSRNYKSQLNFNELIKNSSNNNSTSLAYLHYNTEFSNNDESIEKIHNKVGSQISNTLINNILPLRKKIQKFKHKKYQSECIFKINKKKLYNKGGVGDNNKKNNFHKVNPIKSNQKCEIIHK